MTMKQEVAQRIDEFAEVGWNIRTSSDYQRWLRRVVGFLDAVAEEPIAKSVQALGGSNIILEWGEYRDSQVSYLEGLAIKLRSLAQNEAILAATPATTQAAAPIAPPNRVFLVHGHDEAAKEATARYLEKLDLIPVVLHEQANEGQTIIEKFESHSNVSFAVVLLTPDDVGASAKSPDKLHSRARQNVVLELGYFTGKLGRRRVCALYRPGLEIPSDFHGVLFVELDAQAGWKAKLAQELVSAGMQINLQGLLH
jgi:predicted nucleotide-binding protein